MKDETYKKWMVGPDKCSNCGKKTIYLSKVNDKWHCEDCYIKAKGGMKNAMKKESIEMVNDWIALNPGWEPFQLIPDNDGLQVVFRYKGGR